MRKRIVRRNEAKRKFRKLSGVHPKNNSKPQRGGIRF